MTRLPSAPSSAPKGSSRRDKILLVLSGIALGTLIGGTIVKKCSNNDSPKKPDITDVSKNEDGGFDSKKRAFMPPSSSPFPVNDHRLACEPMSDEEIVALAHKIETEKRQKIAKDFIKRFCVSDAETQEDLKNLVLSGFTELDGEGLSEDDEDGTGWYIRLKEVTAEGNMHFYSLRLKTEPPDSCKPPLSSEESARKREKEKMIEDLKAGKIEQYLSQFNADKIYANARELGLENEEIIKLFLKAIDKAQGMMNDDMDKNAKKKFICELEVLTGGVSDLWKEASPELKDKINNESPAAFLPFNEFENFVGAYIKAQGIKDNSKECFNTLMNLVSE